MRQIEHRIRKLEASGPARQWGYVVACDRPIEDLDLSKVDLDSYPFTWVNGNKAVWVCDDGPPMSNEEWAKKYCTPD
jgi:hypothetical protein